MNESRICMTGFMGCGKSLIGERLADLLSKEFVDVDTMIESQANSTIEEIFAKSGEEGFRDLETKALVSLPDHSVCALGGGALTRPKNCSWVFNHSWVIYLRVGEAELVSRLIQDQTARPLLRDEDGLPFSQREMELQVQKLLKLRDPIYSKAHYILESDGLTPIDAAMKCANAYRNRNDFR